MLHYLLSALQVISLIFEWSYIIIFVFIFPANFLSYPSFIIFSVTLEKKSVKSASHSTHLCSNKATTFRTVMCIPSYSCMRNVHFEPNFLLKKGRGIYIFLLWFIILHLNTIGISYAQINFS